MKTDNANPIAIVLALIVEMPFSYYRPILIEALQARHQESETEKERLHKLLKHMQDN